MSQKGELSDESKGRAKKAIEIFNSGHFDYIITSGWNYREDSKLKISDVMAEFIIGNFDIQSDKVVKDENSRDTVGDAIFTKRNIVNQYNISKLTVVTSDYHEKRTEYIFRRVFYKTNIQLEFKSSKTKLLFDETTISIENLSMNRFKETFAGVDFENENQVLEALTTRHPFYNGKDKQKLILKTNV